MPNIYLPGISVRLSTLKFFFKTAMQFFLKDVHAKIFLSIDLLTFYYSQIMMFSCQECKRQLTAANFVSEKKRVENYPDFEN